MDCPLSGKVGQSHLPVPEIAYIEPMTVSRREWIRAVATGSGVFVACPHDLWAFAKPIAITVYKSPSCGCCKDWVKHVEANGFAATVHDLDDLSRIKASMGIPRALESCHTAVVGRYAIEGHVPADLIKK